MKLISTLIKKRKFKKFFKNTIASSLIFTFFNYPYLLSESNALSDKLNKKEENKPKLQAGNLDLNYLNKIPSHNYILGEGDSLEIILSKAFPEFSDIYLIDTEGTIDMPKIGRIYIKGLTKQELETLLNKKYKPVFKSLNIKITIKRYRPIRVYIKGEVNNPGMYEIDSRSISMDRINPNLLKEDSININPNLLKEDSLNISPKNSRKELTYKFPTLFDVIRRAGGVTYYSDLSNVVVTRKNTISNGGGKIQAEINFLGIIEKNNFQNNIRIFDEDIIKIDKSDVPLVGQISSAIKSNLNPRFIDVSLTGRVEKPGIIRVSKSSTLNDAILAAGGSKALKGKVNFIRFNSNGEIDKRKFKLKRNSERGSYNNPFLAQGDIVHVGKSGFNIANEIVQEVFAPYLQVFAIYKLFDE